MTTLQIILCFWLAGSLLAMWKIWKPSYLVISKIDEHNILVTRPVLATVIVFIIFTIFLPLMVIPLLIPDRLEEFVFGFIKGAKRIK